MTITNKKSSSGGRENNTDRDEELARALQDQFRDEVEQSALPSAWNRFFSSSVSGGSGPVQSTATGPAASAPPARSGRNSNGNRSSGTTNGGAVRTPKKHKKTNNSTSSTPETVANSTPSPDRCRDGFPLMPVGVGVGVLTSLEQQQQRRSTRRSSPRVSPSPRSSSRTSPRGSPRNSFSLLSRGFSLDMFVGDNVADDERVARRLEQELRDAELAASLAQAERSGADFSVERSSSGNVATLPQRSISGSGRSDGFVESPSTLPSHSHLALEGRALSHNRRSGSNVVDNGPRNDCRGKATYYTMRFALSILVGGITFLIFITVFGQTGDTLDPASWLPGYPELDPSLGSVGEHNMWKPNGGDGENDKSGLTLTVLNNLQPGSDWSEHLDESIGEWDSGTPDAVTLNIRTMAQDPDCRAVRRAMKVCNANYGPTDWRGVNQLLLQDDYIITSLAKMNDYYLEGTNRAQKQYTMCHELGHGLGLGHSDENFHNKDLGNCMDYTERPQNNMHPATMNFEALELLYGNVNGNMRVQKMQAGNRRELDNEEERILEEEFEKYAAYLLDPIEIFSQKQGEQSSDSNGGWRLLRKTDTAEFHERQLGNGYTIRTSILLAE